MKAITRIAFLCLIAFSGYGPVCTAQTIYGNINGKVVTPTGTSPTDAVTVQQLDAFKITKFRGTGATASVESGSKVWEAEVNNTISGLITVTIPGNVGFTNINNVQLTAMGGSSAITAPMASLQSKTLTQLVIRVVRSKRTGVLIGGQIDGLEDCPDTGVVIYIRVAGT